MRRVNVLPIVPLWVLAVAAPALAQGAGAADPVGDYRWSLYTACSFVFLAIVVFLVLSHRRARELAQDLDLLRNRVDGFESDAAKAGEG